MIASFSECLKLERSRARNLVRETTLSAFEEQGAASETETRFVPNLFILGAMKCGTSTLHSYLGQLPDVCMSDPKEPFFFEAEYEKGLDFYRRKYFAHWKGQEVIGEARHRNLYLPYIPDRIRAMNPDAKLIAVLRNPVERAFSHWYFNCWHKVETLGLKQALQADLLRMERGLRYETEDEQVEHIRCFYQNGEQGDGPYRTYLDTGYYFEQIERYLQRFPQEALKVVMFEDLIRRPAEIVTDLVEFLRLDSTRNCFQGEIRENLSQAPEPPGWMSTVWHRSGLRAILPAGLRDRVYQLTYNRVRKAMKPKLDDRTRRWLCDHYREHNRRLADWLGRDLSHWDR